jgi:phage/plasmid-associated DNA primase
MVSAYQLKSLHIAPRHSYTAIGPDNPLEVIVEVGHRHTIVKSALSRDTIAKLLEVIVPAITDDVRTQMEKFVLEAAEALEFSVSNNTKAIEG